MITVDLAKVDEITEAIRQINSVPLGALFVLQSPV